MQLIFLIIISAFAAEIEPGPIDEAKLCGGDAIIIDGVCQIPNKVSQGYFLEVLLVIIGIIAIGILGFVFYKKFKKHETKLYTICIEFISN